MNKAWETKTLGEVCDLMTGGTPSRTHKEYFEGGNIKWLVSGDIHQKEIIDCAGRITDEGYANSNAKFLPINSVLIALNGQGKTRGTVALLRTKATCNQSLVSIAPKDENILSVDYLFRILDGRYEEIRKMTGDTGNERRGLNMPLIRSIKIGLPPLPEQKRIVKILYEKFEMIEQLKKVAEQQIVDAKELFESRLSNAFSNVPDSWVVANLEDSINFIDYRGRTPQKTKSGIRLITAKNIKKGFLQKEPQEFIAESDYIGWMTRGIPLEGDVLFTTEAPLANVAKLDTKEKVAFAQRTIILQMDREKLNPDFLFYLMLSKPVQETILNQGSGATVMGIKSSLLKKVPICFPASTTEQSKIAKELEELSEKTKQLEAISRRKIADLDELKKSFLEQAFSGNL